VTVQDFEIADTTWQNITYRHFTALQNLVAIGDSGHRSNRTDQAQFMSTRALAIVTLKNRAAAPQQDFSLNDWLASAAGPRTARFEDCKRIQVDEIWAVVYAKQKNVPTAKAVEVPGVAV
jgi:hypothetical protein